jgi:hypothetical protein
LALRVRILHVVGVTDSLVQVEVKWGATDASSLSRQGTEAPGSSARPDSDLLSG